MKRLATLAMMMAALGLSACGVRGSLERPPPVWGEDQRTQSERAHEQDDEG
jgi:predicted small lipoprotein YifL